MDEGDVLAFEWIKKDITMKISIFRDVKDGQMGDSRARVRRKTILFLVKNSRTISLLMIFVA